MKVVLHDRTGGLGPELREYAQSKLARLARHFEKVAEAEVEFSEERKRSGLATSVCRINLQVDGRRTPILQAHESGVDAQSALDLALDKIDRQVVKLKEKRTSRKKPGATIRVPPEDPPTRTDGEPERILVKLRAMTLGEAVRELEKDGEVFYPYLDEDSGDVHIAFRRGDGSVGVIEPIIQ